MTDTYDTRAFQAAVEAVLPIVNPEGALGAPHPPAVTRAVLDAYLAALAVCPTCAGTGYYLCSSEDHYPAWEHRHPCRTCNGSGSLPNVAVWVSGDKAGQAFMVEGPGPLCPHYRLDLQDRITAWHQARFPDHDLAAIGLKLTAEAGELCDELVGLLNPSDPTSLPDNADRALAEAADVVIVVMALCGRGGLGSLLEAVERKLAVLTDPTSGHRSALR